MRTALFHNVYGIASREERTVDLEEELLTAAGHHVARFDVLNDQVFGCFDLNTLQSMARPAWNPALYRSVRDFLGNSHPDVAHVHNWFPFLNPSVYSAFHDAGVPVVQTLHNFRLGCASGRMVRDGKNCDLCIDGDRRPAVRNSCYRGSRLQSRVWKGVMDRGWSTGLFQNLVDAYIAPSEVIATHHRRVGIPAERLTVLPHACIDPIPPVELGRELAWPSAADRHGAVFTGRLAPEKGVTTLVEAWASLDVRLDIVGSGPLLEPLRARASDLPTVRFRGQLPHAEVFGVIADAGFLVFPTEWLEPIGLGIIEAMACGRPVVASDIGAVSEIVEDGYNGLLVPPGDVGALRAAVASLQQNHALRGALGRNARRTWSERYHPQRHFAALVSLLERVYATGDRSAKSAKSA